MGRVIEDFDIQHGGQTAQTLCADAQRVDFFKEFEAQGFGGGQFCTGRGFFLQLLNVDVAHQGFFCHQHGFFGRTADTDAQDAGRTPARAHGRDGFQYPIDDVVGGIEHGEFGFVFRATAFCRAGYFDFVARHDAHMDDGGGVVFGVLAFAGGVGEDGRTQRIAFPSVGTAYAFVNHLFHAHVRIPLDVHADFEEDGCDTGVLTDGAVVFGTHAAVDQNLRHRVFGGGIFFLLPRLIECVDVVFRMVIADELEGIADTLDKVFLLNDGHDCVPFLMVGRVCSLFIDVVFQTTLIGVIVLSIDMSDNIIFIID